MSPVSQDTFQVTPSHSKLEDTPVMDRDSSSENPLVHVKDVIKYGDITFTFNIYTRKVNFPSDYGFGHSWFASAIQYHLATLDLEKCDTIICRMEEIDWDAEVLRWNNFSSVVFGIKSGSPGMYSAFLHGVIRVVPVLYHRKQDWIGRIIDVAKKAFAAQPMFFMRTYYAIMSPLMPLRTLDTEGIVDYCRSPIDNLFICFTLRVLKDRFPFRCIEVEEFMIAKMEGFLKEHSLTEHVARMSKNGEEVPMDIVSVIHWMQRI